MLDRLENKSPTPINDVAKYKWSPKVQFLIDWFILSEAKLPKEPFELSAYEKITDTVGFYAHIKNNIAATKKISEVYLEDKLGKLKRIVDAISYTKF